MRVSAVVIAIAAVLCATLPHAHGDDTYPNCKGSPTQLPPITANARTIKTVPNGVLQLAGTEENPLRVLHLYGTPREMGLASGALLADLLPTLYAQFYKWVDSQIDPYLKFLPEILRRAIEKGGVAAGLELTALLTHEHTPKRFFDEMHGVAEGAGLDYGEVLRIAMFPELVKASCSMMGAWGPATPDGQLVGLRALDWGYQNPLRNFPLLTVYHPNAGDGHAFSQLGWVGFTGALTGYSGHDAVCEKVWIHYKGKSSRDGIPWTFLLRDILQYDTSLDDAIARVRGAKRTCSIWLGLGSRADNEFRVLEYSASEDVPVFNDSSAFPGYAPTPPEHPLFKGVTYVDKHTQPSSDPCMASIIKEQYGNITADSIVELVARFQTGDLHAAVYDFGKNELLVGLASQLGAWPAKDPSSVIPAYDRQFIRFNMTEMFAFPKAQ